MNRSSDLSDGKGRYHSLDDESLNDLSDWEMKYGL
jgi:hypothetical protein